MKKRLRDRLPFSIKRRVERFIARLAGEILHIAVCNGLDIYKYIKPLRKEKNNLPVQTWGIQDFFWLMDIISGKAKPLHPADNPIQCSIIIPVFNEMDHTFQCLRSVLQEVDFKDNEVIVVNNDSRDEMKRMFAYTESFVRVINNQNDLGFVHACNQGASLARGKYIVFLNHETVIFPGWLRYLTETVERDASVGAVGSMLTDPDGLLKEAGGIIWRDGTAERVGMGENSENRRYRYAREVDYCSSASLLIRKDLFEKLGGFDERYAPNYYEDADLCFGVRSLGFKVIYQPASKLIHYEEITADTKINMGFNHDKQLNRNKFVAKWQEVLQANHAEKNKGLLRGVPDRRTGTNIIVFDFKIPTPDQDAGSARMSMILKTLVKCGHTAFVPMCPSFSPEYETFLEKEGIEIIYPTDYINRVESGEFQVAILSRPDTAEKVIRDIRKCKKDIKIIFETVDIHFLRFEREYDLCGEIKSKNDALHFKELETSLARRSDSVWCVTSSDKEVLQREAPEAKIEIIPNMHILNGRGKDFDERAGLLFIGGFTHLPNRDAIHYFMKEIYPLIQQSIKDIKIYVIGSSAPDDIRAYHAEDVIITGYVPDVDPYFHSCRVFVAPLRYGAGMKGKVGQALSYGVPVITTSIGAEGMGLKHGFDVMIADDPREFAQAVIKAYRDRDLWQCLSDNGYKHIQEHFSPEKVERKILDAIGKVSRRG